MTISINFILGNKRKFAKFRDEKLCKGKCFSSLI